MPDLCTIRSSAFPDSARVIGFRGTEALSRPYVFEVFVQITGAEAHDFDLSDAVGAKAALVISRDDGREPFVLAGIFSEVSLLHELEERVVVRVVLVPQLWRLSQTLHSQIYTQQSIPDIIEAVLKDEGFTSDEYVLRLSGTYKPEEHVCQYRESHLDFLSRWMEREGLYYYFEHAEEGETLVITDSKSFHRPLDSRAVRYFPLSGADVTAGEHLDSFVCRHRQLPASVRYKDYDYNKPTLDVSGRASISSTGMGEINVHGARLFTPDAAKRLAQLRAEDIRARERVFTGSGTALYLRSGCTFRLTDHPRSAFDTDYLAIEVEHTGNQLGGATELLRLTGLDTDEVYHVHVTAIPADVQYRAEEKTPWPRIYGAEHGVVDGEADSEYAQIDDHGRYLVRFAFDESHLEHGKASTWVRMMQPHGGGIEGWHFPLRKATEVLFTFLGGDPDRPVIAGVVPNALRPSPVTAKNHTHNVIQTGGRNRLEMDDATGKQRIAISTPFAGTRIEMGSPAAGHEMVLTTDGNTFHRVGANALHDVGGQMDVKVAGPMSETISGDTVRRHMSSATEIVGGALYQTIHGAVTQVWHGAVQRTKMSNDLSITIGASSKTTIGASNSNFIGGKADLTVGASVSIKASADLGVTLGGSVTAKLANELSLTVGLRASVKAGLDINLNAAPKIDAKTVHVDKANAYLKDAAAAVFGGGIFVFT